jgi:hypothetical protein
MNENSREFHDTTVMIIEETEEKEKQEKQNEED